MLQGNQEAVEQLEAAQQQAEQLKQQLQEQQQQAADRVQAVEEVRCFPIPPCTLLLALQFSQDASERGTLLCKDALEQQG